MSARKPRLKPGVAAAVDRELAALDRRRRGVKGSIEAELALELARDVEVAADDVEPPPLRDRVAAARALVEVMGVLRESAPEETSDRLDELAKRRQARKAS